jgi:hypothetical protein
MATTITTLTVARASFDIWMEVASAETRSAHFDIMNEYPDFFRFDEEAHFRAALLNLHILHDRSSGTITLARLAKAAPISKCDADQVTGLIDPLNGIVKKVCVLRNCLYAHRSAAFKYNDAFKAANLTRNEIQRLLEESENVFNLLAKKTGCEAYHPPEFPRSNVRQLLRDLAAFASSKS